MKILNIKRLFAIAAIILSPQLFAIDSDSDGLDDSVETNTGIYVSLTDTGTNPGLPDTDGDGAGDWYEVATIEKAPGGSQPNAPNSPSIKPNIPYPLPAPSTTPPAGNKPVKVFILSGQSNMVGQGFIDSLGTPGSLATITRNEHKFPNLLNGAGWSVRNDVNYRGVLAAEANSPLAPGQGTDSANIGPELGFGHVMGYWHNEPVLILKSSVGGRALGKEFLPPGSVRFTLGAETYAGFGDSPESWETGTTPVPNAFYGGFQFDQCFRRRSDWAPAGLTAEGVFNVTDVLDNFASDYPQYAAQGFEIAGFAWWQGWNDGLSSAKAYADRYELNMAQFIREIRSYYVSRYPGKINTKAPFVLATCAFNGWDEAYLNKYPTRRTVINAQLAVGNGTLYPEFEGNVKTVEARGYWRGITESPANSQYHYNRNAETFMLVGDALGRAMIDLLGTPAPPITTATPNPQNISTAKNTAKAIALTATNPEGKTLTYAIVNGPSHGTLSGTAPNVTYTPTNNYSGSDSFTFKVNDGTVDSDTATVSIAVTDDSTAQITWSAATAITSASNIQSAGISNLAGANFGIVTGTTTTVLAAETGTVNVEFKSLGSGQNVTLSNGINVAAASGWVNWGLFLNNSGVSGNFGTVLDSNLGIESPTTATITLSGLSIGTQYQIQFFADSTGSNSQTISGSATMNSQNGQFVTGTFTANATSLVLSVSRDTDFAVANALTIGTSGTVTVDTTAPTLSSMVDNKGGASVAPNTLVTYTVTFNEDMDASTVSAADFGNAGTSAVTIGTVTETSPGVFTVQATPTNAGTLRLRINAGAVLKDVAGNSLVTTSAIADDTTLSVSASNIAPVATAQSVSTAKNTAKGITLSGTDAEGSALTYTIVTQPSHGALSGTAPNVTYTPTTNYTGSDSFTFRVRDGALDSTVVTVSITVTDNSIISLTWGAATTITAASDIQSAGVTNLAGVDFGRTNGTTTIVNNGSVNVSFVSMLSSQSAVLPNGITVSATGYDFNVDTSAPAGVTGNYRTVMTKQMGRSGGTGSIILSGLSIGTTYQIQFYITGSDSNTSTIGGSPSLVAGGGNTSTNNNGFGQYVVGTFTADATSKTLVQTAVGNEPVINALTIGIGGTISLGNYDSWVSNYPGLTNTAATVDFDKGGLPSGIERVLGGDPTSSSDDASKAPTLAAVSGNYVFTYRRSDAAYLDPKTTIVVEYSSDFINWTTATPSANISMTENNDAYGAGVDEVKVTFTPAVAAGGKVFVRLKAVVSP